MVNFERKRPSEDIDTADIVRGILKVQAAYAAAQKRPLGRGTHTKGTCARATFEVFDLEQTVGDPELVRRLAHGIYARPGIYPATVRFANAASTIYSDRQADLRALSFSVELPPELATYAPFQDYSLQSAPTFPINDAHTFAVLMNVLSAGSTWNTLKAIWSLSFADFFRFTRAAVIGKLQTHRKTSAYQKMRYWSTVPFRNGPFEAVMYSTIPNPGNPAHELQDEPNDLQDELRRHLDEDETMSSFDFALQLLETGTMTHWGLHRSASFWIENATAEWKESQSPFHTVARLTLVAKSAFPIEECVPRYIDVTQHATPDTQPLGSINRARLAGEMASRKVRLGEETVESVLAGLPAASPVKFPVLRGFLKLGFISLLGIFALYFGLDFLYSYFAYRNIPPQEHVDQMAYLNQGWGWDRDAPGRELYYYTAQGAGMHGMRYSWFVHLERPFRSTRFADPDHMRSLNFIVDPAPTPANPDRLPVGFARRYDDSIRDNVIDVTCAACHTGQLNYTDRNTGQTTAIRIDGGESMAAFTDMDPGNFQMELGFGFAETMVNPLKFRRFAAGVLGPGNTLGADFKLWGQMAGVSLELFKIFRGSSNKKYYPVQEGFGRTDALARIGNVVFGDHIAPANYRIGNAPVSYPYLWNIWKFDWVQYDASVSQPMARNVSEAMGVGADFHFYDGYGRPIPEPERYSSSVAFDKLLRIEANLQRLTPPSWPEDILPPIDKDAAARGQVLFQALCVKCHGPHIASKALSEYSSPGRLPTDPMWDIRTVSEVGTDPTAANNFYSNRVDLSPIGLNFEKEVKPMLKAQWEIQKERYAVLIPALQKEIAAGVRPGVDASMIADYRKQLQEMQQSPVTDRTIAQTLDALDLHAVSPGDGLNILGMLIRERYYNDEHLSAQTRACFAGFATLDIPAPNNAYKPRPLAGVWATPPFLHNGSVPNLYEMLSPVNERTKRFFVGRREFDPVKVGFVTEPVKGSTSGFWMDTTQPGNLNIGHEFSAAYDSTKAASGQNPPGVIGPLLTPSQRMDIIEYLKIHKDLPETPDREPIDCFKLPM